MVELAAGYLAQARIVGVPGGFTWAVRYHPLGHLYCVCFSKLKDSLLLQTQDTVTTLPNLLRGLDGHMVLVCRQGPPPRLFTILALGHQDSGRS